MRLVKDGREFISDVEEWLEAYRNAGFKEEEPPEAEKPKKRASKKTAEK